jgi:hypothetical protein
MSEFLPRAHKRPTPRMQLTGPSSRSSTWAASSVSALWNVSWCGRGPKGLQLMRKALGRPWRLRMRGPALILDLAPARLRMARRGALPTPGATGSRDTTQEIPMPTTIRKMLDCRRMPSERNCSLTIAGTEEEVLTVAVRHAVEEHGHANTAELREQLRRGLIDEPAEVHA